MTSKQTKQRRLYESRLKRAKALANVDTKATDISPPAGSVLADHSQLEHNNTYDRFPLFYVDKLVICRECGKEEVWTAQNQKWWYEEVKANINTKAVRCRSCRGKERSRKDAARKSHFEGVAKKMNTKPGLKLLEEVEGDGRKVKKGDIVEVRLNGWLNEGRQIQKDYVQSIKLGSRTIIPGIEYTVEGMKIHGKRKVKISPHLGYKEKGLKGLIPPNALLIYEVEVLGIKSST